MKIRFIQTKLPVPKLNVTENLIEKFSNFGLPRNGFLLSQSFSKKTDR